MFSCIFRFLLFLIVVCFCHKSIVVLSTYNIFGTELIDSHPKYSLFVFHSRNYRNLSPSAPPQNEVCWDSPPNENVKQDFSQSNEKSSNRRKSEPAARPKPAPRQNRKKSAPASPRSEVQEQNIHNDQITEDGIYENRRVDTEEQEDYSPVRRQSLLMRQGGFQEELNLNEAGTTFEMGSELVILGDIDDLQTNAGDLDDDDIEIECGNNQDDQENFEYSGHRLAEERGSPSSVHSEPDHADNCSVSVGLSVSSLGSDNEEVLYLQNEDNGNFEQDYPQVYFMTEHVVKMFFKSFILFTEQGKLFFYCHMISSIHLYIEFNLLFIIISNRNRTVA